MIDSYITNTNVYDFFKDIFDKTVIESAKDLEIFNDYEINTISDILQRKSLHEEMLETLNNMIKSDQTENPLNSELDVLFSEGSISIINDDVINNIFNNTQQKSFNYDEKLSEEILKELFTDKILEQEAQKQIQIIKQQELQIKNYDVQLDLISNDNYSLLHVDEDSYNE